MSLVLFPDKSAQRVDIWGSGIAVSSRSEHPDRVIQFFNWVQSDPAYFNLIMYGIEGQDYKVKNGVIDPIAHEDGTAVNFSAQQFFMNIDLARETTGLEEGLSA